MKINGLLLKIYGYVRKITVEIEIYTVIIDTWTVKNEKYTVLLDLYESLYWLKTYGLMYCRAVCFQTCEENWYFAILRNVYFSRRPTVGRLFYLERPYIFSLDRLFYLWPILPLGALVFGQWMNKFFSLKSIWNVWRYFCFLNFFSFWI